MKTQDLIVWGAAAWALWYFLTKSRAGFGMPGVVIPETLETTPEEYYEELI